jgi:hypothetical protein
MTTRPGRPASASTATADGRLVNHDANVGPTVDRALLCAWLLDKSRDEDETAESRRRTLLALEHAPEMIDVEVEVLHFRNRAKAFRDIAHAIDRGDPDRYVPPDLTTSKRKSGEHEAVTPVRRDPRVDDDDPRTE